MKPDLSFVIPLTLVICASFPVAVAAAELDVYIDQQTIDFADNYDKRLRYTPSTVVILNREYINNSGALTVAELLERVPGIHLTRKPYGASSNQYIRGIDSNLLILQNGVEHAKLIPELLAMPVVDLERVEIVKGSHYPLYGASAVVGTVNLVTSRIKESTGTIGVRVGTQDTGQLWVTKSDTNGIFGYSAYLSHTNTQTTDGIIDADLQSILDQLFRTNISLAPSDGFFSSEVTDARITLELGDEWTLHQYVNHREFGTGVGLSQVLDPDGEENVTYYSADLRYEKSIGKGDFEGRLTYNYVDMAYKDLTVLRENSFGGALPDAAIQKRFSKSGSDVYLEGLYRVVFDRHTVDIGVGGSRGRVINGSDLRNYILVPGATVPTAIGDFVEFSSTDPLFGGDFYYEKAHLMLRNEYKVTNNVFVNAGGRVDYSSEIGTYLIPRVGVDWTAGQNTNVTLLYGESVQEPSEVTQTSQGLYFAQGDSALMPEKIQLLELSLDHRFNDSLSLVSNIYAFRLRDTIAIIDDADAPNGTRFANLSDNEEGAGVETLLRWDVNQRTNINFGISAVRVNSADLSIATSPRLEPYLEFNNRSRSGINTNIAVIGVANRERRLGDDRAPIDDYTVVNATITNNEIFGTDLNFSLSIQNLFDADAREDVSPIIAFDLPVYPRRVIAGLSYRYD